MQCAMTCAGIATFAQLYAPQGVLPRIADDLQISAAQSALLISAATIGLALSVLPWSLVADRIGRVRTMKISLVCATLLGLAVTAWPGFQGILVLRALEGVALGGLPAVAITYLHEEIHRAHVATAAAIYVAGTSIGGLIGRVVSAPLAGLLGWRFGVLCVAAIGAACTLVFLLSIPEPRGFKAQSASPARLIGAIASNLRRADMLVLYAQGFLLLGGLVAVYNYLTFHLEVAPFNLSAFHISLLLFSYLAGTAAAGCAGGIAAKYGRIRGLCGFITIMIAGGLLLLSTFLPAVVVGLVLFTAGFFGAHAIASGWVGYRARAGASQAASLYNLFYYAGSSFFGWLCGLVFVSAGWTVMTVMVIGMAALAAALAVAHWLGHREEA